MSKNRTQADQVEHLVREAGGELRRGEILDQVDFSETRLDNVLSGLVSDRRLARPSQGLYVIPAKLEDFETFDNGSGTGSKVEYPLTQVGAGPGRRTDDTMIVDEKLMLSELGQVPSPDEAFWAQVQGTSMEPWIRDGQYVLALREREITAPARYVVWWDEHEADLCCFLAKLSSSTVLLRKFGPEKEYRLHHREGDLYEIDDGSTVRMRVRGRVVWPPDTPRSVMETVTDQTAKIVEKALDK